MKSKMLLVLVAMALVASTVIFSACAATAEKGPIKVGGLYSRTGFFATGGEEAFRSFVLAFEQVGYEVAGRTIEHIGEDIASDPTVAMDKARKLIETDKVDLIGGLTLTAGFDAIGPYITKMNMPVIATSGLTDRQALAGWPVWAHSGSVGQSTYTTGLYAYDVLGYRKVSILAHDAEFARGYMGGFVDGFESRGGEIIQEQYAPLDTLDFSPYIVKIVDADAFVYYVIGMGVIPGASQIRELGLWDRMPVIMPTDGELFDKPFLDAAGDAALGIVSQVAWSPYWDTPGNTEYIDAYYERWGVLPGVYAAKGYTSAQILLDTIERTGGDVSFEALSEALDETDIDTIRGHITFANNRLGAGENWIMKNVGTPGENILEEVARYWAEAVIVGDHIEIEHSKIK
jgi:branched-chain amino acid transport system substrate-binding protein